MVGIVAMLGIGFLAHRVGRLRGMLLVLAVGATVLMGVYQLSYSFLALLLVGLVWGWIWSPVLALYDGVLVNEAKARDFIYGTLAHVGLGRLHRRHPDLWRGGRPFRAAGRSCTSAGSAFSC